MANVTGGSIIWTLDADTSGLESGLNKAGDQIDSLAGRMKAAEAGSKMFAAGLATIGVAGIAAAGFGVKFAADLETMEMGFVTLLGSTEKARAAMDMIKRDAAKTPFELAGLTNANQLLTSVTGNANQSERMLLNVGKALTAMGKGQPELDRIIVNLQQIGAVGHASAIDIKQFAFAGIPIYKMINEEIKGTGKNFEDMQKNGEFTFEFMEKMFNKAGEGSGKFARAFELQGGTFNQLMSNFHDNVGIMAADIVRQTGIFEGVKKALSGLITFIGENTPNAVKIIKDMMGGIADNAPIVIGFIVGGLTPAFYALASGIIAAMLPLIPFIAAGVALGIAVKLLVDALGGWDKAQQTLSVAMTAFGNVYNGLVKPALDDLFKVISKELLPNLKELWDILSPVLIPVLKVLAIVIGTIVLIQLRLMIEVLKGLIKWVSDGVGAFNGFVNFFANMPNAISNALSGVKDAITKPFNDAWRAVTDITNKIKDAMNNLNPFVRHSPSLVDNVTRGVGVIKDQISSLSSISIDPISHVFDTPNFATSSSSQGSLSPVNIYIDHVNDQQDVQAIGREMGFRQSLIK